MLNEPQTAAPPEISRLIAKSDEQTTALDQIMTTAADNLAAANSDLKMTLEFIHHVAEYTLAVTRPVSGGGK
jgi:ABC-type dipeptide/oligopeptide/nickel transport system ATPase component